MGDILVTLVRCFKCKKEFELDSGLDRKDYQCECGGKLEVRIVEEILRKGGAAATKYKPEMNLECSKCGKEYELEPGEKISGFQCDDCGGELRVILPAPVKKGTDQPRICPECKSENLPENKFCQECGKPLPEGTLIKCPDCGHAVSMKAKTCPKCGRTIDEGIASSWYLLAILIPLLGILAGMYFATKKERGALTVIILGFVAMVIYYFIFSWIYLASYYRY
jgi:DNA-directed RNA polymerase subunit RPC12/RpoP